MKIKVDYHFHPNLPKNRERALQKANKWWKKINSIGLNVLVVTEHVYKDPKKAFEVIKLTASPGVTVLPGMEYITSEGIDLVIFSNNESIYKYEKIMKPFSIGIEEALEYVENNNLQTFVTHPFTLGTTSIVAKKGYEYFFDIVNKFNKVEVSNGSFDGLLHLLRLWPFKYLFKSKLLWAEKTKFLPIGDRPVQIKLLAVGSDAHIFGDLGNYLEIEVDDGANIFDVITNNTGGKIIYKENFSWFYSVLANIPIVLHEYYIKKKIKICSKLFGK